MGRIYREILNKIIRFINGEPIRVVNTCDALSRVVEVMHPNDSIIYTYGDKTAENFQKGRLISVRYPMGSEEYTYGNMGEVIKNVKSIVIDESTKNTHTYISEFEYDSWNRIQKMVYPDGEVVDYEYYSNGELKSITGEKDGIKYPYLVEAGYNVNGQTAYRKLGNNTEHRYFYDCKDRLQTSTLHIGTEKISVNTYNYDKVDNITSIHDNGIYIQNYTYDELNRLVSANGYDFGAIGETPNSYSMTMEYNKMSSPITFNQSISSEGTTTFKNNTYHYNSDIQPNAPVQIGDMHYTYDAAGNPTSILDANGIGKDLEWNADNQLRSIVDTEKGLFHSYAYDHTGERILKRYGTAQNAYYNGKDMGTLYDFGESYSAYVSPYFVESNNGYTKHYYAGATRLVSKIGEGVYENESYTSYGDEEKEQYFYFQDHLGSSTYITDLNGDIAQYSAYTPYGEMFREYRNVTPYRFNGKELDTETGLYYYGARYYNPSTALWLGVDPLASKYPGVSPYVYCVGNPVKYVDPDGRDWYRASDESIMWTDYTSQEEMNAHNIKGTYLDKVVVTFNGSMNERLGVGDNLFTEGAVLAEATVYGKTRDDIQSYGAFTMTSDYEKFGAIADGTYIVNYRDPGKTGSLNSNWALNNAGPVDCVNGKNPSPIYPYSSTQKNGVYIHRSNKNGWAGVSKNGDSAVSTGCLLIVPSREGKNIGWNEFNQQLTGVKRFTLILKRD